DGLRQRALAVEQVEVRAERLGLRIVADRVVAGVAAELAHRTPARVAPRAEVQLLRPALLGVGPAEEQHDEGREALGGLRVALPAAARAIEDRRRVLVRAGRDRTARQAVIREPAAR